MVLYERIQKLNPFGAIMLEIKTGTEEYESLSKLVDLNVLNIGDMKEFKIDIATITVMRDAGDEYIVHIVRKPDGTLGHY